MRFLGEKLKNIREARHLSMVDLEGMTGIKQGYISEIENGKKNPRPDKVTKLSEALKVDEKYFYLEESCLPTDVLPDMSKDLESFILEDENVPWLAITAKAKENGVPLEVLEKIIDALTYKIKI